MTVVAALVLSLSMAAGQADPRQEAERLATSGAYEEALKRFQAINTARLERTRDALRERQRDFLELLPLLFEAGNEAAYDATIADWFASIGAVEPFCEQFLYAGRRV